MDLKNRYNGLANRTLCRCFGPRVTVHLDRNVDRYVCLNSLDRDSQDLCHVWLRLVRKEKSTDYKYVSWVKNKMNHLSTTLGASPPLF
jgi:hypothetical protein